MAARVVRINRRLVSHEDTGELAVRGQLALLELRPPRDQRFANSPDYESVLARRKPIVTARKSAGFLSRVVDRTSHAGYCHEPPRSTRRQSFSVALARPSPAAPAQLSA
jgi:hypothetical protein